MNLPLSPALPVCFCPANSTVMVSPGLLQPHTGTFMSRCRMALSQKGAPSMIAGGAAAGFASSAVTGSTPNSAAARADRSRFEILRRIVGVFVMV